MAHDSLPASASSHLSWELLETSAALYARSGRWHDVHRLCKEANDALAARIYKKLGKESLAAERFARCREWRSAVDCWIACREYAAAAQLCRQIGEGIWAAWIWAHHAHSRLAALALIDSLMMSTQVGYLSSVAVRARCELLSGNTTSAALLVRQVIDELQQLPEEETPEIWMFEWLLNVTQILSRLDLALTVHGLAAELGVAGHQDLWTSSWVVENLSSAARHRIEAEMSLRSTVP